MTTAATIISDAADLAGSLGQGKALSGPKSASYLRMLNRMLGSWVNDGIDLGLSDLASGDEVYIDADDELAIVYGLATIIYEIEKRSVNPAVYQRASELLVDLQAKYLDIKELEIPLSLQRHSYYDINNG